MDNLTLGSLFDGSGGFPLGGLISGIKPLWASEVEPFPIRVTSKRFPNLKHLGDISKINGGEIEPVDIITFGSPCTDMSVAGKRAGLDGKQSVLFYEAIRIVKEMRCKTNGKYPRFIVWENVPGAFSSNKGQDFKAVLESICSIKSADISIPMPEKDKWTHAGQIVADDFSVAWRVLDAQYWGVPQRRKRIYLVADFAGGCASKILFESEGLSGYSSKSGCPWKNTTPDTRESVTDASCGIKNDNTQPTFVFENHSQDTRYKGPLEVGQTVLSTYGTGGNNQPFVVEAYGICSKDSNAMKSNNPSSGFYKASTSRTLDKAGGNPSCNQGGIAVVCVDQGGGKSSCCVSENISPTLSCTHGGEPAVCLQGSMIGRKDENGPQGSGVNEDIAFTLNATDKHAVVYALDRETFNCGQQFAKSLGISDDGVNSTINARGPSAVAHPIYCTSKASFHLRAEENKAETLVASDYKDPPIITEKETTPYGFYPQMKAECVTLTENKATTLVNGTNPGYQNGVIAPNYVVRRLTPTECARLQGFPDWWCSGLETENPTSDDISFWSEVFETHRKIMGKSSKPKTEKQIIKWLKNPHSDSAEYKMWGNGVALPNVIFVLSGIVFYTQFEGQ